MNLQTIQTTYKPLGTICAVTLPPFTLPPWRLPSPPPGRQWHRTDWTQELLEGGWRPLLKDEIWRARDEWFDPTDELQEWQKEPFSYTGTLVTADTLGCLGTGNTNVYFCRTRRPLPDPLAEVKAAHEMGKVVQWRGTSVDSSVEWKDATDPSFNVSLEWRVKPEPRYVALEPQDVLPGSVFKQAHFDTGTFQGLGACNYDGVYTMNCDNRMEFLTFSELRSVWLINRSIPLTGRFDATAWEKCEKEGK